VRIDQGEAERVAEVATLVRRYGRIGRWLVALLLVARGRDLPSDELRSAFARFAGYVDTYGRARGEPRGRGRERGRLLERDLRARGHTDDADELSYDYVRERRRPFDDETFIAVERRESLPDARALIKSATVDELVAALRGARYRALSAAELARRADHGHHSGAEQVVPWFALSILNGESEPATLTLEKVMTR